MNTSSFNTVLRVVILSSTLGAFWACASEGSDDPPATDGGTAADSGADVSTDDAGDAGDLDGAAPLPCDGASECAAYPNDCTDKTLCAAGIAIDPSARLLALWASGDNDLWAAGTMGLVVHSDGSTWKTVPTGRLETLRAVAGTGPNDVWFSSTDRFLMHNQGISADGGADWDVYDTSSADTPHLMQAMWGNAEQGIWGLVDNTYGTTGLIFHSIGWQEGVGPGWAFDLAPTYMDPPGPYGGRSAIGFGATDVWSGWVSGKLLRRSADDGKWHELNSTTFETLNGMWGTSPDDVWFVGTNGCIRHWDGHAMSTPEIDPSLRTFDLFAISGTSPTDIWIVGEQALVLHYDGQSFTRIPVGGLGGKRPTLHGVRVSATSDQVWAVGEGIVLGAKKGAVQ
jgi:hypothetical protein